MQTLAEAAARQPCASCAFSSTFSLVTSNFVSCSLPWDSDESSIPCSSDCSLSVSLDATLPVMFQRDWGDTSSGYISQTFCIHSLQNRGGLFVKSVRWSFPTNVISLFRTGKRILEKCSLFAFGEQCHCSCSSDAHIFVNIDIFMGTLHRPCNKYHRLPVVSTHCQPGPVLLTFYRLNPGMGNHEPCWSMSKSLLFCAIIARERPIWFIMENYDLQQDIVWSPTLKVVIYLTWKLIKPRCD